MQDNSPFAPNPAPMPGSAPEPSVVPEPAAAAAVAPTGFTPEPSVAPAAPEPAAPTSFTSEPAPAPITSAPELEPAPAPITSAPAEPSAAPTTIGMISSTPDAAPATTPAPTQKSKFKFNLNNKMLIGIIAGGAALIIGIIITIIIIANNSNPLIGTWKITEYKYGDTVQTNTEELGNTIVTFKDNVNGTFESGLNSTKSDFIYNNEYIATVSDDGTSISFKYKLDGKKLILTQESSFSGTLETTFERQ